MIPLLRLNLSEIYGASDLGLAEELDRVQPLRLTGGYFILSLGSEDPLRFASVLNLRQEPICDACDQIRQRTFAVRAVRTIVEDAHFTLRELAADGV